MSALAEALVAAQADLPCTLGKDADRTPSAARTYPTAITGTWDDLERHAWYVYENLDRDTTDWEFAEAVLALLGHEKELRDAAD